MKLAFPLSLKILGWFFLNVLALGIVGWLLLAFQFHLGPEILLSGRSGDRLRALTHTLSEELNASPRKEWNEILERFSGGYGLDFRVYGGDQNLVAGPAIALPAEVKEKLSPRRGLPPRDGNRPRMDRDRDREIGPNPQPRDDVARTPRPRVMPAPNSPLFLVKTKPPIEGYWIGARMQTPPREPREGRPPELLTLLIYSATLSAGGLIVDFSVWIWVALGAFLFSVLFWAPLIYNITRSIRQMTEATSHLAEGNFEVRVNQKRRDELGTLAGAINQMAARLAGFVSGQKRFTGDIAHELCSPIARMQMAVSIMEQQPMSESQQAYVKDLREDVEQMSSLVNELLAFSKAALGGKNLKMQPVQVSDLVAKAIRMEGREGTVIHCEVEAGITALADPDLLFRAIANVLRNAIKYAGEAGPIAISAAKRPSEIEISIRDSGAGVPEGDLPKLFDPFYRVDLARARETGGAGLGLAIVKTCIESCAGSVRCRNLQPHGFEVIMRLPAN